jgi:acyl-CoA synthetase (NDP forming)
VIDRALERGTSWLDPEEVPILLAAAGIDAARSRLVGTPTEAVQAASDIGFPVALKAVGPTLLHKTERGAVRLNIQDQRELEEAVADFRARLGADLTALLVQRMVPAGVEMIVGAVQDPQFGPVIACGTGGVLVDVLADVAFRLHPLSTADAQEMIDGLRGARLLRGYRNSPPVDEAALRGVLLRVSELVAVCPEIQELDLNPVMVIASGACVADARVRVGPEAQKPPTRRVDY